MKTGTETIHSNHPRGMGGEDVEGPRDACQTGAATSLTGMSTSRELRLGGGAEDTFRSSSTVSTTDGDIREPEAAGQEARNEEDLPEEWDDLPRPRREHRARSAHDRRTWWRLRDFKALVHHSLRSAKAPPSRQGTSPHISLT
ncbi:hypothetical protein GWK47_034695 [Chionoecetes opilio]|uniref:Uncharacterized protein n=1 Tax=Chionoecetes opilio TaxID=41210 RepID=A0A8J4YUN3_CHIOP|nr:hypothetical protein GWK47_034695 [Chionoecetes opilio]